MTSVEWVNGAVRFIDQTRLPAEEVYVTTSDFRVVAEAITALRIRGAPAIGVAAAFAVVLASRDPRVQSLQDLTRMLAVAIKELAQTRPTAVNLFTALSRMEQALRESNSSNLEAARALLEREACAIGEEDREACRSMGEFGATLLKAPSAVLTHCNTGALATVGEGTAQSVITTAHRQGKITHVFADETRPLLQGARLTTWELQKAGVDVTLITDSTAAFLMQQRKIDAVLVGADRIAANGDTANKVGTYAVAVLARHHGIPFYVIAPTSTLDISIKTGAGIQIEERSPEEVTHLAGQRVAPQGVNVYAPAFDITPNELVTAIVTECGVLKPPFVAALAEVAAGPNGRRITVR